MEPFTTWDEGLVDALAEPFAPASHSTKRQGGSEITFVDVHEYKDRLNATVGPHGWSSAVRMEAHGGKLIFVVARTILGVTKENVGDEVEEPEVNERGNAKIIGSSCTNAYAQAFKRTCSDFGLGAYLYDKERREAATRGAPKPAAQPTGEGGGKATERQMAYLDKLMKSKAFTEAERDGVARKVASMDRGVVSKAIEWAKEQLDARTEARREAREPAGV